MPRGKKRRKAVNITTNIEQVTINVSSDQSTAPSTNIHGAIAHIDASPEEEEFIGDTQDGSNSSASSSRITEDPARNTTAEAAAETAGEHQVSVLDGSYERRRS
jgi:hypothetical protein